MTKWRVIDWIPVCPDDVVVWISVTKLDASWKHHAPYYVGVGVSGPGNGSLSRYQRFGEWLAKGEPVWMPHVGFSNGHVSFSDGRHRFAWLRDHGVKALPVTVSPDIVAEMKRRFGTRSRISRFIVER